MPFSELPGYNDRSVIDWNLRFLKQVMDFLSCGDTRLPLLKLMEILKGDFVDGCAVTTLKDAAQSSLPRGPVSIVDWLTDYLQERDWEECEQIHVWDAVTKAAYMAIPLTGEHWLILWRLSSMFTPDDSMILRLAVSSFRLKYKELDLIQETIISNSAAEEKIENTDVIRHQAQLYKEIVNTLVDFVLICDYDGRVLHVNQAGQAYFQLSKEEMLSDTTNSWLIKVCHPDDLKILFESWGEALQDNASRMYHCRFLCRPNEYRRFLCRLNPIRLGSTGEVHYWAVIGSDLEDSETMDEVKTIAKMKGQFLAEISHEIRTPLACVLGTATLLSHTKLDGDQEELVKTIAVSSQQLSNLISDVLDLTKIEESKLLVDLSPVNLEKVVNEIGDQFRADLVKKRLDLLIDLSSNLPKWLVSDELRLRQILTNYVSNAIKFSKNDSIVRISAKGITKDRRNLIEFAVEDEGIGISEAPGSGKLFEKFSQRERSTAKKYGGSGLGLVISKKLIELLGGETWYRSVVGRGTTFFFTIALEESWDLSVIGTSGKHHDNSPQQELNSLQEMLSTLANSHLKFLISLEMSHPKAQDHYQKVLGRLPAQWVSLLGKGPVEEPSIIKPQAVFAVISDRSGTIKTYWKGTQPKNIIYMDYECPQWFNKDLPTCYFLRKPTNETAFLQAVISLIKANLSPGAASAQSAEKESVTPWQPISIAQDCPLNILVAEDDELNQKLLVRILGKLGYRDVRTASDGVEAINALKSSRTTQSPINVIFMDMQMPNLDGCSASKLIRDDPLSKQYRTHIIAMTANAFVEDRDVCLRSGMCDYASKPVKWENLEELLKRAFKAIKNEIVCPCHQLKD